MCRVVQITNRSSSAIELSGQLALFYEILCFSLVPNEFWKETSPLPNNGVERDGNSAPVRTVCVEHYGGDGLSGRVLSDEAVEARVAHEHAVDCEHCARRAARFFRRLHQHVHAPFT